MCQLGFFRGIRIIAWMVNCTVLLPKWSTVHVAWMNYCCRLTRISISGSFDKAEWNFTVWKAKGSGHFTDQFTSTDAFAMKPSKQVTRTEIMKNDSMAQRHLFRWLQQNWWLMPGGYYSSLENNCCLSGTFLTSHPPLKQFANTHEKALQGNENANLLVNITNSWTLNIVWVHFFFQ